MAEKPPKRPVDEEAHFRIDEMARDRDEDRKALHGMVPAIMALIDDRIEKAVTKAIEKFKSEDKAEDHKMMAQMIREAMRHEDEGEVHVHKRGTVQTPEGEHRMDVMEIHKRVPKGAEH